MATIRKGIVKISFLNETISQSVETKSLEQKPTSSLAQKDKEHLLNDLWVENSTSDEQEILIAYLENNQNARKVAESQHPAVLALGKRKLNKVNAIVQRYEAIKAQIFRRRR